MNMIHALKKLENIHAIDQSGVEYFGCDQNWYASEWQKISGCGPSTASTVLLYLQKSGRISLPIQVMEQKDCALLMEAVWSHVTPTPNGIYLVEQFCSGIRSFAQAHGFSLNCHSLDIPENQVDRPGLADTVAFITQGLDLDCPIAFLNLGKGDVNNLEEWHWVTVVALEKDEGLDSVLVTIFDGDKSETVDFRQWFETTVDGGALIYLDPV